MDDREKARLNLRMMTPLQLAQKEWEDKTTRHPKERLVGKKIRTQEFRKFGEAIAWLRWDGNHIEMKKMEKLPCAGRGSGTSLINFVKSLADNYQVRIFGNPMSYDPDPPIPCGHLLTQGRLESWYKKHGFKIVKIQDSDIPIMWYPDLPPQKLTIKANPLVLLLLFLMLGVAVAQQTNSSLDVTNITTKDLITSAEKGDAAAQSALGVLYYEGKRVPQDYVEAIKWTRKAAEQGLAKAQCNLGVCYANGEGVSQNYAEAALWFRKAADQGLAHAQYNLGVSYEDGNSVPKKLDEALKYYRQAAEQDDADAQTSLGMCYDRGQGVPKNPVEAVKWYRKAAVQGASDAQYNLGLCYQEGDGVTKDLVEAVKWYSKAATLGDTDAKAALDDLETRGSVKYYLGRILMVAAFIPAVILLSAGALSAIREWSANKKRHKGLDI
jgi:TPR repeat protein